MRERCATRPTRLGTLLPPGWHDRLVSERLRGVVTVLLPGTGSDDDYLRRAFGEPLRQCGARPVPVRPAPRGILAGYRRALTDAAAAGPIAVGGVSLGAAVAAAWALAHPDRTVAVLAALPPWTGDPGSAPAAVSARYTAAELRRHGLDAVTDAMRASSPAWLAGELARSWRRQWPDLPDALDQAAGYPAPTADQLRGMEPPMAVVGAPDDLVHPLEVAREWAAAAPRSALRVIGLDQFGPDPAALGRACLAALTAATES